MPRKDENAWMYRTLGTPPTPPTPPNKGRELAGSRVKQGGVVVPKSVAERAGEARREQRRRDKARAPKVANIDYVCDRCDPPHVTAGPHKDATLTKEQAAAKTYKGCDISNGSCDKANARALDEYMRYRREHPREET